MFSLLHVFFERRGVHAYATKEGGSHVKLSPSEARQMFRKIEAERKARSKRMPDETAALREMFQAYQRLRELGWKEVIYCPKDGTPFRAIEAGSTGIHRCRYEGTWPDGRWLIDDCSSQPILFRLYPEDQAKEDARRKEIRTRILNEIANAN